MFDDWDAHIVPVSFHDMKYSAIPFLAALLTVSGLHASPPQYLSQLHTEILGRLPSAEEWNRYEKGFATENFEIPSAEGVAIAFFGSQEWRNLKYSSIETSYVLYRSLLLREPSTEEMRLLSAQVERSGGTYGNREGSRAFSGVQGSREQHDRQTQWTRLLCKPSIPPSLSRKHRSGKRLSR